MQNVNIAMIPKKGEKNSTDIYIQNGIFIFSIFRSILMKILLKDKYEMWEVGRVRIQDHLFIINGMIFDHAKSKNKIPLIIAIYDFRQCFDSKWQQEVIHDFYEAGIQNN